MDVKKPQTGKNINETFAEPNNAKLKDINCSVRNTFKIFLTLYNFNNAIPNIPPTHYIIQNKATVVFPTVSVLNPWYSFKNFEIHTLILNSPC